MVADAKASVTFISAQDFKKKVESGEKYYLIDCREAVEFDSVCIKGAINIPRTVLEAQVSDKAPKKEIQYIYIVITPIKQYLQHPYCLNSNMLT